eukprot:scaffold48_cov311-Pinguiococcus_pyrenoidosus.AAC.268
MESLRGMMGPTGKLHLFRPGASCPEDVPRNLHLVLLEDYPSEQGFPEALRPLRKSHEKFLAIENASGGTCF